MQVYPCLHNPRRTQAIVKGSLRFGIPGRAAAVQLPAREHILSGQRHEGTQRHQAGPIAQDGFARPLALGFDAQMSEKRAIQRRRRQASERLVH